MPDEIDMDAPVHYLKFREGNITRIIGSMFPDLSGNTRDDPETFDYYVDAMHLSRANGHYVVRLVQTQHSMADEAKKALPYEVYREVEQGAFFSHFMTGFNDAALRERYVVNDIMPPLAGGKEWLVKLVRRAA